MKKRTREEKLRHAMIKLNGIKMTSEEILKRAEGIYNEVEKHTITVLLDNKPCAVSVIGKDYFDELQLYLNHNYWDLSYIYKHRDILQTLFDKALLVTDGKRWLELNGCSLPDLSKMINIKKKQFMGNHCTKFDNNKCLKCSYSTKSR